MINHRKLAAITLGLLIAVGAATTAFINLPGKKANPGAKAAGSSGKLLLSPTSASVTKGGAVTYTIKVDAKDRTVNAVQANLSYPTSYYGAVSIDSTSSAFSIEAASSASGGNITIARANFSPVSGVVDVAKITLNTIAAGSAPVTWASGSAVMDAVDNTNILGTSTGATTTITNPVTPTPPPPAPSPSPSPTPTPSPSPSGSTSKTTTQTTISSAPANSADTTPPIISDLRAEDITETSAVIKWTTNEPTTGKVEFGLGATLGFNASSPLGTTHSVTLQKPLIDKGITYTARVVATDAAGNGVRSSEITFDTPGFEVTVKVVDENGQPIANAVVTVDGQTVKTDSQGIAVLKNVKADTRQFTITSGGKTITTSFQVGKHGDDGNYLPQQFQVKASRGFDMMFWVWVGVGLIGLMVLVVVMMSPGVRRSISGLFHKNEMTNMQAAAPVVAPTADMPDALSQALNGSEGMPPPVVPGTVVHPEAPAEAPAEQLPVDGTNSSD